MSLPLEQADKIALFISLYKEGGIKAAAPLLQGDNRLTSSFAYTLRLLLNDETICPIRLHPNRFFDIREAKRLREEEGLTFDQIGTNLNVPGYVIRHIASVRGWQKGKK